MLFTFAGSNCSSSSEGESIPTALHAGICVRQQSVSIKDAIIAREALSLLVTCLQLRCQQLCKSERHKRISFYLFKMYYRQWCLILYLISPGSFYNLPSVNDFIIDILLGSPSEEVKKKGFFYTLAFRAHSLGLQFMLIHLLSPLDPTCGLWPTVHSQPVWHFSFQRTAETQPVPALSRSHSSTASVESNIYHERSQPEVVMQKHIINILLKFWWFKCYSPSGYCLSAQSTLT